MPSSSLLAITLLSSLLLPFFLNNFSLFHVMAVFPTHFPPIALSLVLSVKVYALLSFSSLPPLLLVTISHVLPSYFILTLVLIRLSISLVHWSRLFFLCLVCVSHSPSLLLHPQFLTVYLLPIPPVSFFFLTPSHTLFLFLFLFHSSIFMPH